VGPSQYARSVNIGLYKLIVPHPPVWGGDGYASDITQNKLHQYRLCGSGAHLTVRPSPFYSRIFFPCLSETGYCICCVTLAVLLPPEYMFIAAALKTQWIQALLSYEQMECRNGINDWRSWIQEHQAANSHFDVFHFDAIRTPPLWSSVQSSWLQNGDVLCFLWGTNWIYICYVEENRTPLWSSVQSSWLQNGDVLCFLWGTNWIYICYVEENRPPLWSSGRSYWLHNGDVLCFLWGTNWIYICYSTVR
jgi:hypothetical protein